MAPAARKRAAQAPTHMRVLCFTRKQGFLIGKPMLVSLRCACAPSLASETSPNACWPLAEQLETCYKATSLQLSERRSERACAREGRARLGVA